jgi:hypothetical protein
MKGDEVREVVAVAPEAACLLHLKPALRLVGLSEHRVDRLADQLAPGPPGSARERLEGALFLRREINLGADHEISPGVR